RVGADLLVHPRLRERRLVGLVVAETTVSDEVDQEVLAELLTVGAGHTGDRHARLRVIGIDMDDRYLESFGKVTGIERRARILRIGRKPDLVVCDNVDRS